MKRSGLAPLFILSALLVRAEVPPLKIPEGGIECLAADPLAAATFRGKDLAKGAWVAVTNGPAEKAWAIDVKMPAERAWAVTLGVSVTQPPSWRSKICWRGVRQIYPAVNNSGSRWAGPS